MKDSARGFKIALIVFGAVYILFLGYTQFEQTLGINGLLYPNGTPVGGDFINLWSTAKLLLEGRFDDIYRVDNFAAYQATLTGGAEMGVRLWAYPPQSLLLVWPLGLFGYYAGLAIWSISSIVILIVAARRFGFDWLETTAIAIAPATTWSFYTGQTGSIVTAFLLLALAPAGQKSSTLRPAIAATLLTVKPQAGFLLPVLWGIQRRWTVIAWAAAGTIALALLSILIFGTQVWRDYLGDTVPTLSRLEAEGSGMFVLMIPSTFMSMRILTGDSAAAISVHMVFAAAVLALVVWRLWRVRDDMRRASILLISPALISPYIHNYDLGALCCGALLVARRWAVQPKPFGVDTVILLVWALPPLVILINHLGLPISPLIILALLLLA